MQVKPLFLLFISIPLTGEQYIRDVYVEGMLNCFHLGLKTTEEVYITGVLFSRFSGERRQARSERGAPDMVPDQESPLGIKQRRFFFEKSCAKVMRNIVFMCMLQLEIHFSRVNDTHSVSVWSFPRVVSSTNKSFTFMNSTS